MPETEVESVAETTLTGVMRPLHDKVLIKRLKPEDTTKGGIVIPDSAKEKTGYARVIAVGPGMKLPDGTRHEMDVEQGQLVMTNKGAGAEFKFQGDTFFLLEEVDILSIIEEDPKDVSPTA